MVDFFEKLRLELGLNLPGFAAQMKMAPLGRKPPLEYLKKGVTPKSSAVLVFLYPDHNSTSIKTLFIERPERESSVHAGQIAFPGGAFDLNDDSLMRTALREAEEEVGIPQVDVQILGRLTPLYIPVSNFMVHPFVGYSAKIPNLKPHPDEVRDILNVDISTLIDPANRSFTERYLLVKDRKESVPCFNINNKVIWGATAMIVSELTEVLKRID